MTRKTLVRITTLCCLVALIEVFSDGWPERVAGALITFIAIIETVQVTRAAKVLREIADGDRFVAFPDNWIESAPCADIAAAGERMRRDLIEADAAIADQNRMLAEARIRREGEAFFTSRFHASVAEAFTQFSARGEQICSTVDDLNTYNAGLLRDARQVSEAVSETTDDVSAVSRAAADIADVVAATSREIERADAETQATVADLKRARQTIERLKQAGHEISTILGIIRSVATQTSLLALNATIEAARAGESGRGFAVVANEVKALASKSSDATNTIRRQIEAIQGAVEETSRSIDTIIGRVDSLTSVHRAFTNSLADSTAAIEQIGANAGTVVTRVSQAMPDLASGVGEIETAGRSVLANARSLMARSETLVGSFRAYFEDLASGSIKVGILHSLSGTVTAAERPLHDLLIGLIDETNRAGGLLGRPLEAMIVNPRAKPKAYADGARHLLAGGAAAIFGCWTSRSRIETIPVLAEGTGLLFYPSQYEGGEASPNIVYAGATPQQQAWPALDFLLGLGCKRLVLVGHDTIYSRGTHAAIKRYAPTIGAAIVADISVAADARGCGAVVAKILRAERDGPVAVVSSLSGDASVVFFREMAHQGVTAKRLPTLSVSIGEAEMAALDPAKVAGNYVSWPYLHRLQNEENRVFIETWRRISGNPDAIAYDALHATYVAFSLWRDAVRKGGNAGSHAVREALSGTTLKAPNGASVKLTTDQHLMLPAFVGQVQGDGAIEPVWTSRHILDPAGRPFAPLRLAAA